MTDRLTRTAASQAVQDSGWRYVLGAFQTTVTVRGMDEAARIASAAVAAAGADASAHLRVDLRPDRVEFALQDVATTSVGERDVELAHGITDAVRDLGLDTLPTAEHARPVQALEFAIDTLDAAAIRPFWKAVLGYVDEPGSDERIGPLVDPVRQGPTLWFQRMDEPRPQRNRIHVDVTVSHEEAQARVDAALAAGGRMVSDAYARSFWVLADSEGNEVCVCTWLDRDERG